MKTIKKADLQRIVSDRFIIELSRDYSEALKSYCRVTSRSTEEIIRDAIVKELIELFIDFNNEEHVDFDNGLVKSEECLKEFFDYVKRGIESSKSNERYIKCQKQARME